MEKNSKGSERAAGSSPNIASLLSIGGVRETVLAQDPRRGENTDIGPLLYQRAVEETGQGEKRALRIEKEGKASESELSCSPKTKGTYSRGGQDRQEKSPVSGGGRVLEISQLPQAGGGQNHFFTFPLKGVGGEKSEENSITRGNYATKSETTVSLSRSRQKGTGKGQ